MTYNICLDLHRWLKRFRLRTSFLEKTLKLNHQLIISAFSEQLSRFFSWIKTKSRVQISGSPVSNERVASLTSAQFVQQHDEPNIWRRRWSCFTADPKSPAARRDEKEKITHHAVCSRQAESICLDIHVTSACLPELTALKLWMSHSTLSILRCLQVLVTIIIKLN